MGNSIFYQLFDNIAISPFYKSLVVYQDDTLTKPFGELLQREHGKLFLRVHADMPPNIKIEKLPSGGHRFSCMRNRLYR
jgi:hypothetical protein